jgi:hypothetical protein
VPLLGRVYTPIIVSPITTIEERNKEGLDLNIEFACLDGQHRSRTIAEFVNNDFGFTGTIKSKKYNNVQFSNLPEDVQDNFLFECEIHVCTIDKKGIDLAKVFTDIHKGTSLNDQEKRNAMNTPISEWVRTQAKDFSTIFEQIRGCKYQRMDDCALITRMATIITGIKNKK